MTPQKAVLTGRLRAHSAVTVSPAETFELVDWALRGDRDGFRGLEAQRDVGLDLPPAFTCTPA
jgi:hypothetical protein